MIKTLTEEEIIEMEIQSMLEECYGSSDNEDETATSKGKRRRTLKANRKVSAKIIKRAKSMEGEHDNDVVFKDASDTIIGAAKGGHKQKLKRDIKKQTRSIARNAIKNEDRIVFSKTSIDEDGVFYPLADRTSNRRKSYEKHLSKSA